MFYRCFLLLFFFVFCFFRPSKNMRQPFSGKAERIFMKLLPNDREENVVCIATNTVHAFACTSAKFPVFGDSLKIFCCNPHQTFTANSPRGALQVWKILWTLTSDVMHISVSLHCFYRPFLCFIACFILLVIAPLRELFFGSAFVESYQQDTARCSVARSIVMSRT